MLEYILRIVISSVFIATPLAGIILGLLPVGGGGGGCCKVELL